MKACSKRSAISLLQLEDIRRGGEPTRANAEALKEGERRLESLREEIAAMSRTLAEIAPRNSLEAIETAIHDLTLKLEASRVNGGRDALLAPIEQLASELREAFAAFDPRAIVARLEIEIRCDRTQGRIVPDLRRHRPSSPSTSFATRRAKFAIS